MPPEEVGDFWLGLKLCLAKIAATPPPRTESTSASSASTRFMGPFGRPATTAGDADGDTCLPIPDGESKLAGRGGFADAADDGDGGGLRDT